MDLMINRLHSSDTQRRLMTNIITLPAELHDKICKTFADSFDGSWEFNHNLTQQDNWLEEHNPLHEALFDRTFSHTTQDNTPHVVSANGIRVYPKSKHHWLAVSKLKQRYAERVLDARSTELYGEYFDCRDCYRGGEEHMRDRVYTEVEDIRFRRRRALGQLRLVNRAFANAANRAFSTVLSLSHGSNNFRVLDSISTGPWQNCLQELTLKAPNAPRKGMADGPDRHQVGEMIKFFRPETESLRNVCNRLQNLTRLTVNLEPFMGQRDQCLFLWTRLLGSGCFKTVHTLDLHGRASFFLDLERVVHYRHMFLLRGRVQMADHEMIIDYGKSLSERLCKLFRQIRNLTIVCSGSVRGGPIKLFEIGKELVQLTHLSLDFQARPYVVSGNLQIAALEVSGLKELSLKSIDLEAGFLSSLLRANARTLERLEFLSVCIIPRDHTMLSYHTPWPVPKWQNVYDSVRRCGALIAWSDEDPRYVVRSPYPNYWQLPAMYFSYDSEDLASRNNVELHVTANRHKAGIQGPPCLKLALSAEYNIKPALPY